MSFKMDDYVDVAERIRLFYEKYPDGRLTRLGEPKILNVDGKTFVVYTARAFRTADDPHPAIGTAWEPFPGPSSFTKDSELMNAETAAWGRAIIAVGIPSKKIASAQEVKARQTDARPAKQKANGKPSDVPTEDVWLTTTRASVKALQLDEPAIRGGLRAIGLQIPTSAALPPVFERMDTGKRALFTEWLADQAAQGTPLEPVA